MKRILFKTAALIFFISITGCTQNNRSDDSAVRDSIEMIPGQGLGTAWAGGSFKSNGERIYFTATSERGTEITYTGGPEMGMMMMRGRFACASCHGLDAKGGKHMMHMEVMDAPDIRWSALAGGHHEENNSNGEEHHETYTFEDFRNSVENGRHPDGDALSRDMPRWNMSDADLRDLMEYLKSLD